MSRDPARLASTRPTSILPAKRRLNLTGLQFVLFAGAALVGLAALTAAGAALGLALAGAGVLAVVALAAWVIGANLIGLERRR